MPSHRDKLGQHSRTLALAPNVAQHVFSVVSDRDTPTTWMINATNRLVGITPSIILTVDHTGPSGVTLPIQTEIGPSESVQLFVTGAVNVTAIASAATTLEISITAIGGGQIPIPPERFTVNTNAAAWVGLSASQGLAPPGRRWAHVVADGAFDLEIRDGTGAVMWTVAAVGAHLPRMSGPIILPPGYHLRGKGNGGVVNITTTWTQRRDG